METSGFCSWQQRLSEKENENSWIFNELIFAIRYHGCRQSGVQTQQAIRNRLSDHQHCDLRGTGGEQAPVGDICSASVFCRNKKAFKMPDPLKIFFFFKQNDSYVFSVDCLFFYPIILKK